jgi:putative PEP-CTERM system TPR-repeat lipoprotein
MAFGPFFLAAFWPILGGYKLLGHLMLPTVIRLCLLSLILHAGPSYALTTAEYYEDAVAYTNRGQYEAAIIQLKNALIENPDHLPSRLLAGTVYMRTGDSFSSEKELRIALRLGAARDQVYPGLGNALLFQRKYQAVLDTITTLNAFTPEAEQVYVFRARAHLGLNQLERAEENVAQAVSLAPDSLETLLVQAALLKARADLPGAEALIDRAIEQYPLNLAAQYEKGLLLVLQGEVEAALASYDRVLTNNPMAYRTLAARASAYLQLGRLDQALADFEVVYENVPQDFNVAFSYAHVLRELGREEEAKEVIAELVDLINRVPESRLRNEPKLLRTASLLSYMQGDLDKALVYGSLYLSDRPYDVEMGKLLGSANLQLGEDEQAIELLHQMYRRRPDDPELLTLLGEAHLRKGNYSEASALLERAAEIAPESAAVGTRLSMGKFGLGLPDEGEELLLRSFSLNSSESAGAGFILAQVQLNKGQTDAALATIRELLSRQPTNPIMHNLYGVAALQGQNLEQAREAFEVASRLAPYYLSSEYNLALLDLHEGKYLDAKRRLNRLIQAHPDSLLVLEAMANLEQAAGYSERAVDWLVKAAAMDHSSPDSGIRLVDLYIRHQLLPEALKQGEINARLFPESALAAASLARAQSANGDQRAAQATYRKAVVHSRGTSGATLLYLSREQVALGDYTAARGTLLKASNTLRAADAQVSLIKMDMLTGDIASAEARLATLARYTENKAIIPLLRGDIRMEQKRYEDALAAYAESLAASKGTLAALGRFKAEFLLGRRDEAQLWMANWVKRYPEDIVSRRSLYRSWFSTGDRDKASEGYESLFYGGYADGEDLARLARIYQLEKDERALDTASRAVLLLPDSAEVLDTYGWILVTEDRAAEGLPYLREAVSRESNLLMRYHLASALNELGRTEESRKHLQTILNSQQNLPWIASAQNLFDSLEPDPSSLLDSSP